MAIRRPPLRGRAPHHRTIGDRCDRRRRRGALALVGACPRPFRLELPLDIRLEPGRLVVQGCASCTGRSRPRRSPSPSPRWLRLLATVCLAELLPRRSRSARLPDRAAAPCRASSTGISASVRSVSVPIVGRQATPCCPGSAYPVPARPVYGIGPHGGICSRYDRALHHELRARCCSRAAGGATRPCAGAARWETVWRVVVPYARSGILGSVFLARALSGKPWR
jgi:hypothetical protein